MGTGGASVFESLICLSGPRHSRDRASHMNDVNDSRIDVRISRLHKCRNLDDHTAQRTSAMQKLGWQPQIAEAMQPKHVLHRNCGSSSKKFYYST